MKNESFEWRRFMALFKAEWMQERGGFWPILISVALSILLRHPPGDKGWLAWRKGQVLPIDHADWFLTTLLMAFLLVSFSNFMRPLQEPKQRGWYLLLPASSREKFLARLLLVSYPLIICLLLIFPFLPWSLNFVSLLFFNASVAMLCSVLWPRYTFLRLAAGYVVVLIIGLLVLAIVYLEQGSLHAFVRVYTNLEFSSGIFSNKFSSWLNLSFALCGGVISYFRLRETDECLSW